MAAAQEFLSGTLDVSAPGTKSKPILPHATNELDPAPRSIFVGTGGSIVMRGIGDTTDVTWKNVPSGAVLPFRPSFIRAAGTTAADIVGIY